MPFTWACRRSGRCCSAPGGYTWLEPGEEAALAGALGLDLDAFRARHVRSVPDPSAAEGSRREALTEHPDGRCTLLEGTNECRAYGARPAHCRSFPDWPSVLSGGAGFERARSTCPGIAVAVAGERRAAGLAALSRLVEEAAATWEREAGACALPSVCSRPPEEDREHFVSGLEADWCLRNAPTPRTRAAPDDLACPWRSGGASGSGASCSAGRGRPLSCRIRALAPDAALRERRATDLVDALQQLEGRLGWPASYGRLADQVASRLAPPSAR